jgi:hypothetical protein
MKNPLKREPKPYVAERDRLLEYLGNADPATDEYQKGMARLNELDRMMNRTTELKKTVIPALGTIGGVAGIYALQQFGGVIVPRVLEAIGSRSQQRHPRELD